MKTLIILLGCLTANAVTAADEHFEARLAAVSTPLDNQQADTLAANETQANNALATEPDIMCMALLETLSARRISDPFGVRTYTGLHPTRRCANTPAAHFARDVVTVSFSPTAGSSIGTTPYLGTGITTNSWRYFHERHPIQDAE